ncbi:hypothetical protein NEIPOLOT_01127 [Neisseria polysaccharea ATCC 43768]|nr:hypothetical protein NEIPOLOT_01127 [Neisseria polysaccharea ATCC 43768]
MVFRLLDSHFRGNDGLEVSVFSMDSCCFRGLDSRFCGNDDPRSRVIPAQAGI